MDDIVEVFRGHTCRVGPANRSICPEDVPLPNGDPYFTIEFTRNKLYYEAPQMVLDRYRSTSITQPVRGITENRLRLVTDATLSAFDIPEADQSSMATKILEAAADMLNNTHKNHKVLNMVVHFDVYVYYYDNVNYHNASVEASMEEHGHNYGLVPASDSSIEGLERVELEQVQGLLHCVICLKGFKPGRKIIRMPCSHIFHRSCIARWLHCTNECPLCRFQMPTSDH